MEIEALEEEARASALKLVANMLQRPGQLEKVDQYKRKISRKKASVESMLKTAIQTQLDGVRCGLNDLQNAISDIKEIKQNLREVDESFGALPRLSQHLKEVREESIRHSQYMAAMENLKYIFNVPESIKKTEEWIMEGQLLLAHERLSDLENSRDDLQFELYKVPNQSPTDKNMLKQYFADVEKLSQQLGKQLWMVLGRTLTSVRKQPQAIVTALRIVEREERADAAALARYQGTGFMPPGRPKKWREQVFRVLQNSVEERIEGNQLEDYSQNKVWLAHHLKVIGNMILDDIKVVQTACVPCFPPSYDIVNAYISMYHKALSKHLMEIINNGLHENEYITFLNWLKTFEGPQMLGSEEMNIDVAKLGPLLPQSEVDKLVQKYLDSLKGKYVDWMKNMLESDVKDWYLDTMPEDNPDGHYTTSLPVLFYQMLDQHLNIAKSVDQDVVNRVLIIGMEQAVKFCRSFSEAVVTYKNKYFENRSSLQNFTRYMSAFANNCLHFEELSNRLRESHWKSGQYDNQLEVVFQQAREVFDQLRERCIRFLIEELFKDLDGEISNFLTRKWLDQKSNTIDTICITVEDYYQDYTHLMPRNFDALMTAIQNRIAKGYILAILHKKLVLKVYEERKALADKIVEEKEKFQALFNRLAPSTRESPFECLPYMAEVLRLKDPSMLALEITSLIKRFPDMTLDQLVALATMRGDIGKNEAKQMIMELMPTANTGVKTIFSHLTSSL